MIVSKTDILQIKEPRSLWLLRSDANKWTPTLSTCPYWNILPHAGKNLNTQSHFFKVMCTWTILSIFLGIFTLVYDQSIGNPNLGFASKHFVSIFASSSPPSAFVGQLYFSFLLDWNKEKCQTFQVRAGEGPNLNKLPIFLQNHNISNFNCHDIE